MELQIVYQDENLVVVDKPVDLPVHKNDFMPHDADYLTKLIGNMTGKWIYNVHRLDSKTSGLIVLAFSSEVAHQMALLFERKEVHKKYMAVVQGDPGSGKFETKVVVKKKSKFKKPALTNFHTIQTIDTGISFGEKLDIKLSLVEIEPETGRWHQIRQHFAQHRFDILGDSHHGDFTLNKIVTEKTNIKRLFLHASEIGFIHPITGEKMLFKSEPPGEFQQIFNLLSNV